MKAPSYIKSLLAVAVILLYYGFRFVTQAGQGLNAVQNDGYGGTGGVMLLVSGCIVGYIMGKGYVFRKTPKRKDIKKVSEENYTNLTDFAKKLKDKK